MLVATGLLAMMFSLLGRAGHPRLVGVFAGFLNVVLFFPSGAIYPVESFPPWLRAFARYNPETHAVNALKSILFKGVALSAVAGDLLFLAGLYGSDAGGGKPVLQADAVNPGQICVPGRVGDGPPRAGPSPLEVLAPGADCCKQGSLICYKTRQRRRECDHEKLVGKTPAMERHDRRSFYLEK